MRKWILGLAGIIAVGGVAYFMIKKVEAKPEVKPPEAPKEVKPPEAKPPEAKLTPPPTPVKPAVTPPPPQPVAPSQAEAPRKVEEPRVSVLPTFVQVKPTKEAEEYAKRQAELVQKAWGDRPGAKEMVEWETKFQLYAASQTDIEKAKELVQKQYPNMETHIHAPGTNPQFWEITYGSKMIPVKDSSGRVISYIEVRKPGTPY